jgi:protein gp37
MSILENSIGWCDATGNPVIGCRGCELGIRCYARNDTPARVLRAGQWPGMNGRKVETFGPGSERVPTKKGLEVLAGLNKLCICNKCHETFPVDALIPGKTVWHVACSNGDIQSFLRRIRYFADSNSDWMDWPIDILARALEQIRLAPNVDVILCTKWAENWGPTMDTLRRMNTKFVTSDTRLWIDKWYNGEFPNNVWLLTSITTAKTLKRAQDLLNIPAAVHGLSMEPLWENIVIPPEILARLDWIIVGGESGGGRRDCGADAIVAVAKQAMLAGVPCYIKQDSATKPGQQGRILDEIWKLKQFPMRKP